MNDRPPLRRGLGRGLGSLIPSAAGPSSERFGSATAYGSAGSVGTLPRPTDSQPEPAEPAKSAPEPPAEPDMVAGALFAELPVDSITPNPRQPRQVFDEDAMAELAQSVAEVGLLQPVVVRRVGTQAYELVMGERRLRASRLAGLSTIPAIVRDTEDDALLRDALLENLHRAQLNPLEEAAAYQQLLDDFGCTQDELARRIGRSRPQISNTLRLLRLAPSVQRRLAAGVLSAGHARALLASPTADVQERLAHRVVAEGISVRGLEELMAVGGLDEATGAARAPRNADADPELLDLAARLSDTLETRVGVHMGRRRGRITIEFADRDDLRRVEALIISGRRARSDIGDSSTER